MADPIFDALLPLLPALGTALPPLLGTLVGGLIAVLGQYVSASMNARSASHIAEVAARRAVQAEDRAHIADLLRTVSADAAPIIARWRITHEDGSEPELLGASEDARRSLHPVRERAMSIAAAVSDEVAVRATDRLFGTWDRYLSKVEDRISLEHQQDEEEKRLVGEVRSASGAQRLLPHLQWQDLP